jgi:hypothetical protein
MHGIHVKVQIIVNKTNHNKAIIRAAIQLISEDQNETVRKHTDERTWSLNSVHG